MQEMASTPLIQFPVFTPTNPLHHHRCRPATEVRFSRWNNANAEKFNRPKRTQKEIEDQLRFHKRYDSALNIAHSYSPAPPTPTFKSTGTPSAPSRPSIPGKKSKYSKPRQIPADSHPAFKPLLEPKRFPAKRGPARAIPPEEDTERKVTVKIDGNGLAYELPDAAFVYQYSYTETPKVKPVGIREPLVAPFEPSTMARPWTGRKPLPASKKKLPEFDSFKLPPPNKKGVKTVQPPGPYLPGTGPKYVRSRKEILGEPLTKEEVLELVESTKKWKRQLNMGRDGFTHNMLENIHAHWKRRRVCKIKCKGVCTVDMANVRRQLEDKTGGQVIYSRGGLIYLFRGRNYNYRDRPRYPLMLWKPVSPVYPRLVQRVPEGLTLEEATEMRRKGRDLTPICKLGKNGVYCDLVKNVKEAFEACELVRINCQGMNGSDYRKIGAKLKDLVPCVLVSFESEHILMWRGRDWKSSYPEPNSDVDRVNELKVARATLREASSSTVTELKPLMKNTEEVDKKSDSYSSEVKELEENIIHRKVLVGDLMASVDYETPSAECEMNGSHYPQSLGKELDKNIEEVHKNSDSYSSEVKELEEHIIHRKEFVGDLTASVVSETPSAECEINGSHYPQSLGKELENDPADSLEGVIGTEEVSESDVSDSYLNDTIVTSQLEQCEPLIVNELEDVSEDKKPVSRSPSSIAAAEEVKLLLKMAVENGSAMILEGSSLDPDMVYEKAVILAKSAPPGPVFRYGLKKKKVVEGGTEQPNDDSAKKEDAKPSDLKLTVSNKRETVKKGSKRYSAKDIRADVLNMSPKGTLRVDELAKLLS